MSKSLSTSVDLPVDVERAFELLTGPSWPAALDEHLHDGSRLVSADRTPDGGAVVAVSRRLPDGGPSFMQKLGPRDGRVVQTDTWGPAAAGARRGTWSAAFPGSPGDVSGTTVLEPTADGCRWTVAGQVSIRLPLVGGKIESYLAPLVEKLVARQAEVLRELVG